MVRRYEERPGPPPPNHAEKQEPKPSANFGAQPKDQSFEDRIVSVPAHNEVQPVRNSATMETNGNKPMIDTVLNLLFNCPHRHLTRPFTPISKNGAANSETYVVCLDCAKQFPYDLNTMRMGKAIEHSHEHCVLLPKIPPPRRTRVKYAVGIGLPLGVLIGTLFAAKKSKPEKKLTSKAGPKEAVNAERSRRA